MSGKKLVKSKRKYDPSLKRKIAQEYLDGQYSYRMGAEIYGLPNKDTVKEFVRWYKRNNYFSASNSISSTVMNNLEPEKSAKELQEELRLAKMKIRALETMIDIAEDELSISIRKKSEAKQSKK